MRSSSQPFVNNKWSKVFSKALTSFLCPLGGAGLVLEWGFMAVVDDINEKIAHQPVMLGPVLAALAPRDGGIYVDGTFGAGGYSRAILRAANCTVIGIDRDPAASVSGTQLAKEFNLNPSSPDLRFQLLEGQYSDMEKLLTDALDDEGAAPDGGETSSAHGVGGDAFAGVDGVALDIGVSSMQLDQAERGFSFMKNGPLDMRMSQSGLSAADVVNTFEPAQLKRIIKIYGEEKRAHSIVTAICRAREDAPLETTGELSKLIEKVIGVPPGPRKSIHPATRTFQALRIFVNGELDELVRGLAAAERILKPDGRLAVVSFHSLEDRIVKRFLKRRTGSLPNPSRHAPMADGGDAPSFKELVRGGETADDQEIAHNVRARSARLRSAVRTDAPAMALEEKELAQGVIMGI